MISFSLSYVEFLEMTEKIGAVIAQSFREIMNQYNPTKDYYEIDDDEINLIVQILRKIDHKGFDLIMELEKFLGIEK